MGQLILSGGVTFTGGILMDTFEQYSLGQSLRFNSGDSTYMSRTGVTPDSQTTFTVSGWVKRTGFGEFNAILGGPQSASSFVIFGFDNADSAIVRVRNSSGTDTIRLESTAVFRDPNAWYHYFVNFDSTQATASDRVKLYINGVQITDFITETYPPLNGGPSNSWAGTGVQYVGLVTITTNRFANEYLSDVYYLDGLTPDISEFAETDSDGVWAPKEYTGSVGTNGFHLSFADSGDYGLDSSGNGNDFTANNFTADSQSADRPNDNFCVLSSSATPLRTTISNGYLDFAQSANNNQKWCIGTVGFSTGAYAWQVTIDSSVAANAKQIGIQRADTISDQYSGTFVYDSEAFGSSDVVEVLCDNGDIVIKKNGSTVVTDTYDTSYYWVPVIMVAGASANQPRISGSVDFGQISYNPPVGYNTLSTANLPEPEVITSTDYFNTVLYTGTGTTATAVTGVGFQPDLLILKDRNNAADAHCVHDSVRGANQVVFTELTLNEQTYTEGVQSFDLDGFTVGDNVAWNRSTYPFVAWNWRTGTAPGVDVQTYSGTGSATTVSHGLSATPDFMLIKKRTGANVTNWIAYHKDMNATPENGYMLFNTTAAFATESTVWNNTAPTSSNFTVGTNVATNFADSTYVAFLFAGVEGFSDFGPYTGNGSADGPFVYTGFKPAFVIIKRTNTTSSWFMEDNTRNPYNEVDAVIVSNASDVEATSNPVDFLANGFKLRSSATTNVASSSYVYMAFAEHPFKYARAR